MQTDLQQIRRVWSYIRPHQRWCGLFLLLLPVTTLCQIAGPLIIQYAIDEHLLQGAGHRLLMDVLLLLAVLIGEYAARVGERFSLITCGILTLRDVRRRVMAHLIDQPVPLFERQPLGVLVSRVTSDIEAMMDTLSTGVVHILSDGVTLIAILMAMCWLSPQLALVTLTVAVPMGLILNVVRLRLRHYYDRSRQHTGRMHGVLNETITGLREVQLFRYEPVMQARFDESNAAYCRDQIKIVGVEAGIFSVVEGVGILTIGMIAWYGAQQILHGQLTIGVLVAFITYIQRFYTPIKEISNKLTVLQGGLASLARVFGVLDHDERQPWGRMAADDLEPTVELRHVFFVYPQRQDVYALHDVSLTVQAGERVALVGWTGSGKSTIVKLLSGMCRPTRGEIMIGSQQVTAYAATSFQQRVGVVHQEVHLFADTVAFNIGLGRSQVSHAQIQEACRIVQADAFIQQLPRQYDTVLDASGANLSQGQRQLLGLARVLAWSPRLVILDEATSSVDSHAEQLIQAAILEVMQRTTTIVIAHRLATVMHADRIVVLHEGRVVEEGTHEALVARDGYYRDLYEVQFAEKRA